LKHGKEEIYNSVIMEKNKNEKYTIYKNIPYNLKI